MKKNYLSQCITSATASMISATLMASPVFAQSSDNNASSVEEVIVTINRREQSLQNFAGTAQAFSQDDLAKAGVGADFQSLQAVVPGLQISFNEGFQEIYIRGIGTQANGPSSDQPTAVHYNGAYIPKTRGLGPVMFDLERIEVNQGPQGTLRGRNATAGSINILPKLPELDNLGGKFTLGVGNYDSQEIEAALNIPLNDTVATRFAYFAREHDDYYSNAGLGEGPDNVQGTGSEDEEALRWSLLWETELFSGNFVYDHMTMGGSGFPGQFGGQLFSTGQTIDDLDDPWNQFFQTQGRVDNVIDSFVLTLNFDFGLVGAELIGSYREFEGLTVNPRRPFQYGFATDQIQNVDDIINVGRWANDNYNTNWISDINETSTVELRFFSNDDESALYWTAGIFISDESADEFRWDTSDRATGLTNLGGPDLTNADAESFSVYADATYELTDTFRVKGGVRYTDEEKTFDWWEAQVNIGNLADITDLDGDGNISEVYNDLDSSFLRLSTPGFDLVRAGDQTLSDPRAAGLNANDFVNSFVSRFGGRDTWGDILAAHAAAGTPLDVASGVISTTFTSPSGSGIFNGVYEDDYINWRLGFEWDSDRAGLVYGTVSTGTRAGGVNTPVFNAAGEPLAQTFDPEELTAFELGSKNTFDFNNMSMTLNLAAFYYQYDDQVFQVGVAGDGGFDPNATNVAANLQQVSVNVGKSEIIGLTIDGSLDMPAGFNLGWNILLNEAEIKEGTTLDGRQTTQTIDINGVPTQVGAPNIDVSGNPLINASDVTAVINFGQDINVGWGSVDWTLTASYRSSFHATPFANRGYNNLGEEIPLEQMITCCGSASADAFGDGRFFNDEVDATLIWNASAGTNFGDNGQYRLEAYVQNLTEEGYAQKQIINHFVNIAFINTPRTAGIRFKTEF
ncbi:TonB-dependent receptor [Agarilytica rhodophyticola]|uniref:TonB-dependent receptor n=1 Tax=Agarilytica rhodophyticola TaxID=1737490 RepID=UPI000B343C15|nr:TonB-dependent receptor [Agarilytica rhodophyticola]